MKEKLKYNVIWKSVENCILVEVNKKKIIHNQSRSIFNFSLVFCKRTERIRIQLKTLIYIYIYYISLN